MYPKLISVSFAMKLKM